MARNMTQVKVNAAARETGEGPAQSRAYGLEFWVSRSTKGKLLRFWIVICLAVFLAVVPH